MPCVKGNFTKKSDTAASAEIVMTVHNDFGTCVIIADSASK